MPAPFSVVTVPAPVPPNRCDLGISPRCTREDAYLWGHVYACAHCYSMAEAALESGGIVPLREQAVRR